MDTPQWTKRIEMAESDADVLAIVREYLNAKAASIKLLPIECQPMAVGTAQDIEDHAYRLVCYHAHGENARMVQSVSVFFSAASFRLAELSRR